MKRPRSLILAGLLTIVQGAAFMALFGIALFTLLELAGFAMFMQQMIERPSQAAALEIILSQLNIVVALGLLPTMWFVFGLSSLVIGFSLLRLHVWAWLAGLIVEGMVLAWNLVDYFSRRPTVIDFVSMVVAILIVLLLNQVDTQLAVQEQRRDLER